MFDKGQKQSSTLSCDSSYCRIRSDRFLSDQVGSPEDRFSRVAAHIISYEPRYEKTRFLPMQKQRRRSAVH